MTVRILAKDGLVDDIKRALSNFPTTPARILFTIWLTGCTGLALGLAMIVDRRIDADALKYWLVFLAAMAGLDVGQWIAKRKTEWTPEEKAAAQTTRAATPPSVPVFERVTERLAGAAPRVTERVPALDDTATHRATIDGPSGPRIAIAGRTAPRVAVASKDAERYGDESDDAAEPIDDDGHDERGRAL